MEGENLEEMKTRGYQRHQFFGFEDTENTQVEKAVTM
jgi:hypothetical protein